MEGRACLKSRGKAGLSQTHLSRAQPHAPTDQGSSMVPWINTQTPPLIPASPASPPLFPHGLGSGTPLILKEDKRSVGNLRCLRRGLPP